MNAKRHLVGLVFAAALFALLWLAWDHGRGTLRGLDPRSLFRDGDWFVAVLAAFAILTLADRLWSWVSKRLGGGDH